MVKKFTILLIAGFLAAFPCKLAWAGFGVSPAVIKSDILLPGTVITKEIGLLRSSAAAEEAARIIIDAPEISSWLSLDPGSSVILPPGEWRVPVKIRVAVPPDAAPGHYRGQISVSIVPAGEQSPGIAVATGALAELDLTVITERLVDFEVREVNIPEVRISSRPWLNNIFSGLKRNLKLVMRIENIGNSPTAPSRVVLDVYGVPAKELLGTWSGTRIEKIAPYVSGEAIVSFPCRLPAGQYWGKIKVYKENEIVFNDQLVFSVKETNSIVQFLGKDLLRGLALVALAILALFLFFIFLVARKMRKPPIRKKQKEPGRFNPRGFFREKIWPVWLGWKFKARRWLHNKSGQVIKDKNRIKNKQATSKK